MASQVEGARGKTHGLRLLLGVLLLIAVLGGLLLSRMGVAATWERATELMETARSAGPAGWIAVAGLQTLIAVVGVVPASLVGMAAGAVYGLPGGFVLSGIGTVVGGWVSFALARSLLRPWVERLLQRRIGSRFARLDQAVGRDGWRFVCLLRISPIMPFALTSYALGLTEISGRDYLLGTLAALPALLGYVALGALARFGAVTASGANSGGPLSWALLAAGIAATAVLILRSAALLARCGLLPGSGARG